jgi:broad specificity phosphatase PhoE
MTARRRIFLMRHGSVTYFDDRGRPYPADNVPLNREGQAQARAAGLSFAAQQLRFDRVITSGLPRTIETATLVLTETGQHITPEIWPDLSEIRGGRLADIDDADLHAAFIATQAGVVDESQRFLGGESLGELMDRVQPALARLLADPDWDTVLMVLHEGVNRAILSFALTGQRLFLGGLAQSAGCINALDVGERDWLVRFVNFAPLGPLQHDVRGTTMEQLYEQYRRSRGK